MSTGGAGGSTDAGGGRNCEHPQTIEAKVLLDGRWLAEGRIKPNAALAVPRRLAAGAHTIALRIDAKPGTSLVVRVEVPGPVIDSFSPLTGDLGAQLEFIGEGFLAPISVAAGATALANPLAVTEAFATANTVPEMPSGPLSLTTPFGTATSREAFVPTTSVMSESQYAPPPGVTPTLDLGEDCSTGRTASCTTGVCAKAFHGRGRGYFCTRECLTEGDCPLDWACHQVMPGRHGLLCVPPETWTSRAVGVRP